MAHDVFISHSARDKVIADAICAALESAKVRCWIAPRDVRPGDSWAESIINAIEKARVFVLVFTQSSNLSPQVAREVERAANKGLIIIPVRIEAIPYSKPLEYFLSSCHWLDALTPPLEARIEDLVATIRRLVAPAAESRHDAAPPTRADRANEPALAIGKQAAPTFEIRLSGDGVLAAENWHGELCFHVWLEGPLELKLTIRALTAPVILDQPLEVYSDGTFRTQLRETLQAGESLKPEDPPRSLGLELQIDDWNDSDLRQLAVVVPLRGLARHVATLRLERVRLGDLAFSLDSPLVLNPLQVGDVLCSDQQPWGPLEVMNRGESPMWLGPPTVRLDDPSASADWLQAAWGRDPTQQDLRQLDVGHLEKLQLTIDLRSIEQGCLPRGGGLAGTLEIRDEHERAWRFRVVIVKVNRRPPCPHPVAFDLGNTHCYAAVFSDSANHAAECAPLPLLGLPEPESFPSAVYFDRVDPAHPEVIIGREALLRGQAHPAALVRHFQQWIGILDDEGSTHRFYVQDRHGGEAYYDVSTIVRLMLDEMLRQCQDTLRQEVGRIALACPFRLGSQRTMALRHIVQEWIDQRSSAVSPPLRCEEFAFPECMAVALDFVLDPAMKVQHLAPFLREHKQESVVLGVFDFCGRTIDTALLRLVVNEDDWNVAPECIVAVGGDAEFGGDNVTIAILEILQSDLMQWLNSEVGPSLKASFEVRYSLPGNPANPAARANFQILWRAAEKIKVLLCHPAASEEDDRAIGEMLASNVVHLQAEMRLADGQSTRRVMLAEIITLRSRLWAAVEQRQFISDLARVYSHAVRQDLAGRKGYTVESRVAQCVDQLAGVAQTRGLPIDFVILAGGGCRLPLVRQLLAERLPGTQLVYDATRPKSRVAFGLARYLALSSISS